MCTPRNLVLLTRSKKIFFVLLTFSRRLLSLYHVVKRLTSFVVGLIILGYETHQSGIVCKLHHVIGAVGWCAVVSQQGDEQGTEHTALWVPCAERDAARGVVANSYCLWSVTEEVQYPIAVFQVSVLFVALNRAKKLLRSFSREMLSSQICDAGL